VPSGRGGVDPGCPCRPCRRRCCQWRANVETPGDASGQNPPGRQGVSGVGGSPGVTLVLTAWRSHCADRPSTLPSTLDDSTPIDPTLFPGNAVSRSPVQLVCLPAAARLRRLLGCRASVDS
jgi:hypothetical protein